MPDIDRRQAGRLVAIWVLISLALLACSGQPGVVEGTVTQAADDEPLAQAEIVVYELQTVRGSNQLDVFQKGPALLREPVTEDGSYNLSLEPGSYIIQVWSGDAPQGDRLVEVKAGRKVQVDFEVTPPAP